MLLAFDYDGTLAPIVTHPERARLRPATSRLLGDLTNLYPCIVISGRAQADVLERLRGIPVHGVVGNHGIEPWQASERVREEVERWRPLLEEQLSPVRGVSIEDKVFSIAVHYRQSREKKKARAAIMEAAAALDDVRVIGGHRSSTSCRGGPLTRASPSSGSVSVSDVTPRSTWATTRRTRTSSLSISQGAFSPSAWGQVPRLPLPTTSKARPTSTG